MAGAQTSQLESFLMNKGPAVIDAQLAVEVPQRLRACCLGLFLDCFRETLQRDTSLPGFLLECSMVEVHTSQFNSSDHSPAVDARCAVGVPQRLKT